MSFVSDMPEGGAKDRAAAGKPRRARGRGKVVQDPRSRMLAAMVELAGEQGCAATTVAHVIARAGASRKTFYEHFEDKQSCFLVAAEQVASQWEQRVRAATEQAPDAGEAVEAFVGALFEACLQSPASLRIVAAELTAAGEQGIERRERLLNELALLLGQALERLAREDRKVRNGYRLPPARSGRSLLARALTGAIVRLAYARGRRGERMRRPPRGELMALVPDVARWVAAYRFVPERQLRGSTRETHVPVGGRAPGTLSLESQAIQRRGLPRGESAVSHSFVVHSQRERLLDALANLSAAKGYHEATIPEIVHEAAVSVQAFYEHFAGKEDAFCVAYEVGQRKLLAIVERAYEAHAEWPAAARSGLGTLLEFLASEPSFARIWLLDALTVGAKVDALAREGAGRLTEMIKLGLACREDGVQRVEPMVEATVAALLELCYVYAADGRARELPALLDLATHVALAPFATAKLADVHKRAARTVSRRPG
jgi:AcrR family transcriptional regulator